MQKFNMTEEKVRKLLPVVESILSREYGRTIRLKDLTVGGITVKRGECAQLGGLAIFCTSIKAYMNRAQ